jgi:thiosulfate/3-mercaptopyruvate sulfurtransferase
VTRTIEPLVSAAWLDEHLPEPEDAAGSGAGRPADKRLLVVDIREPRLYEAGHIRGSVSIPFSPMSAWAVSDDELLMELPPDEDLFQLLSDWAIDADTTIVLVGTVEPPPAPPYALSDAPRVAVTLFYAGVEDVAILDGGFPLWASEEREASTDIPDTRQRPYTASPRKHMFVSTEYVREHLGEAVLIDGRDPDQFFGVTPCPFAGVGGHIPTARSLPAVWIWKEDGTYRPADVLRSIAEGVIGSDKEQEIIVYCGVGGYASALWFVLTQILDYRTVKIYDGAAEAWVKTDPMASYTW